MITFRNRQYSLNRPISSISVAQLIKYVKSLDIDSPNIVGPEFDRAASYHFKLVINDLPVENFTEEGLRGIEVEDIVNIFSQVIVEYNKEKQSEQSEGTSNDKAEIETLKQEIQKLKEGK